MKNFTNKEIAKMLRELADLMEIKGENKYRVGSYYNAARKIMEISEDLNKLVVEDNLQKIRGIGTGIAGTIKEIFENGFCPPLEELKMELPAGVLELIKVPGLGPKRAHQLFYQLGIQSIGELKKALIEGKVKELKGFGPKSGERLLQSLEEYECYQGVIFLCDALVQANKIIQYLEEKEEAIKVEVVGSIRRQKELIGNIDILVAADKSKEIMNYFLDFSLVKEVLVQDDTRASIITEEGIQVDLRVVKVEEFPAALQYFTGSKEHNTRLRERVKKAGFKLDEHGLFKGDERVNIKTEADIYQELNLDYIIPELREDRGEIRAAAAGNLPQSISLADIKGDLHIHSRYSDGAYTIEEMVKAARKKGYQYIAITDHSQSLRIAHGMTPETLAKEIDEIEKIQVKFNDIKILKGIEVDILNDGSLDYSDEILSRLDLVIASIHTGFNQSKEKITNRIIKAMENPYVKIIAHPQGRILGRRKAYQVDMNQVIEMARKTGTCLEINASPYRLDLDDVMVKKAKEAGVKIVINTDSHHVKELDDMALGVGVARRGWLEKKDILNTMNIYKLLEFLRRN